VPLIADVCQSVDEFVCRNAGRFLRPLACSHFRWSYHHEAVRELTMTLLCAHVDLPPDYVVLWIFDWLDGEFIWRSSESQRIKLIRGVSTSVKHVRAARNASMAHIPPASPSPPYAMYAVDER
jgi:hypothetical protein